MGKNSVNLKGVATYLKDRLGFNIYDDPYQQKYVSSLIAKNSDVQGVFLDAEAGTGKTSLAISVAYYLLENKVIDQIIYIRNAVSIREMGFLPGDVAEKEAPYMQPGLDALSKLDPLNKMLISTLIQNEQLVIASTGFLRGVDWDGKKMIIIDEAQNLNLQEMQTVLTRPHDDSKVVVIGSSLQCDEGVKARRYGVEKLLPFQLYSEHFSKWTDVNVEALTLRNNYRGNFSKLADKIQFTIDYLDEAPGNRDKKGPDFKLEAPSEEMAEVWQAMGGKVHSRRNR